jgi:hypothetical protein
LLEHVVARRDGGKLFLSLAITHDQALDDHLQVVHALEQTPQHVGRLSVVWLAVANSARVLLMSGA